eukprot:scaffold30951_cov57-Phaeocystis_antarctica.AAC.4
MHHWPWQCWTAAAGSPVGAMMAAAMAMVRRGGGGGVGQWRWRWLPRSWVRVVSAFRKVPVLHAARCRARAYIGRGQKAGRKKKFENERSVYPSIKIITRLPTQLLCAERAPHRTRDLDGAVLLAVLRAPEGLLRLRHPRCIVPHPEVHGLKRVLLRPDRGGLGTGLHVGVARWVVVLAHIRGAIVLVASRGLCPR